MMSTWALGCRPATGRIATSPPMVATMRRTNWKLVELLLFPHGLLPFHSQSARFYAAPQWLAYPLTYSQSILAKGCQPS